MRRLVGIAVLLGTPLWLVRRHRRKEHLVLYFDNGSTVTLEAGNPEAASLLSLARQGL